MLNLCAQVCLQLLCLFSLTLIQCLKSQGKKKNKTETKATTLASVDPISINVPPMEPFVWDNKQEQPGKKKKSPKKDPMRPKDHKDSKESKNSKESEPTSGDTKIKTKPTSKKVTKQKVAEEKHADSRKRAESFGRKKTLTKIKEAKSKEDSKESPGRNTESTGSSENDETLKDVASLKVDPAVAPSPHY
uniref:Secreted protein n=1 Tax=Bursaphelenchus xylophilus TaxID=6326 RepID=A0A1I7SUR1_BURXY